MRYDNLDKEVLQLMKRANCSFLYFGLESGSDQILKEIDKKTTVEQIIKVSDIVADSGIFSNVVIMGLPYETMEERKKP